MKDVAKLALAVIEGLVVLFLLGWAVQGNSFFMFKFFAPKYEQVRRETFEQTKSYRDGMTTELRNMQMDYAKATKEQKTAIRSIVLHRVNGIVESDLPYDIQQFVSELRKENLQ